VTSDELRAVADAGDGRRRSGRGRIALAGAGLAALAFGVQQLVVGIPVDRTADALLWLAAVLVAHDAVVAPLAVAVGAGLRRVLPGRSARLVPVVGIALYLLAVLTVLALPLLLGPGSPGGLAGTG
jgi:hypothetical protein